MKNSRLISGNKWLEWRAIILYNNCIIKYHLSVAFSTINHGTHLVEQALKCNVMIAPIISENKENSSGWIYIPLVAFEMSCGFILSTVFIYIKFVWKMYMVIQLTLGTCSF